MWVILTKRIYIGWVHRVITTMAKLTLMSMSESGRRQQYSEEDNEEDTAQTRCLSPAMPLPNFRSYMVRSHAQWGSYATNRYGLVALHSKRAQMQTHWLHCTNTTVETHILSSGLETRRWEKRRGRLRNHGKTPSWKIYKRWAWDSRSKESCQWSHAGRRRLVTRCSRGDMRI